MLALIARRFRMLGDPFRLKILQLLETGERGVGELANELDGKQPNVSKHLRMLLDAGLVDRRREGASVYYSIADPMIFKLCALVCRSTASRAKEEFDELIAPVPSRRG